MLHRADADILAAINRQGKAVNQAFVDKIKDACRNQRRTSSDYEARQEKLQEYLDGRQLPFLDAAMAKRFPNTHPRMPRIVVNMAKHVAESDASSYDDDVDRWLESEVGDRDEEATEAFADMLNAALIQEVTGSFERALMAAKTMVIRVGYESIGERVKLRVYWPNIVFVVTHPDSTDDIRGAVAIAVHLSDDDGGNPQYEVWRRTSQDTANGVDFGPWFASVFSGDGHDVPMFGDGFYPADLPLPFVFANDGLTPTLYLDGDHELTLMQDNINVGLSDYAYGIDLNAAPKLIRKSDMMAGQPLILGAGSVADVGTGDDITQLPSDTSGIGLEAVNAYLQLTATVRQQPGDAYAPQTGSPESGVARAIKLVPAAKSKKKRQRRYKAMEEQQLLPIMMGISDFWGGTSFGELVPRVKFAAEPEFEDLASKTRRVLDKVTNGIISKARAAVDLGDYDSIEDAKDAGVSDAIGSGIPSGGGLAGLSPLDDAFAELPLPIADDEETDEPEED